MSLQQPLEQLRIKLQLLLKEFTNAQKEILRLKKENNRLNQEITSKNTEIGRLNEKVDAFNVNNAVQNNHSKKELEKRINGYLKEIDKCLALLNT